jgi:hypothetical protein
MRTANRNTESRTAHRARNRVPRRTQAGSLLRAFVLAMVASLVCLVPVFAQVNAEAPNASSKDVYVPGPGTRPQLMFACCDQGTKTLNNLFADPTVLADLKELHAGLAISLNDLSAERARVVRDLNEASIPVVAWLVLSPEQGYYVNASNAPQTAERFAEFESWSKDNNLHWDAVGLDIEPNFEEFQGAKWRIAWTLFKRSLDGDRVRGPRQAYAALIRKMQTHGYRVQTYQMNFLADERKAHSTVLERLFGLVDMRGDDEVLMAYSSFNHKAGSAVVWSYGQDAQTLAVGSTLGTGNAETDAKFGPLNWQEFSRDTIVASHFSHLVGVYSLEGCVHQGFLSRLKTEDWNQGVTLGAAAIARMQRFRWMVQTILWTASHLLYFLAALFIAITWLVWRGRKAKQGTSKGLSSSTP